MKKQSVTKNFFGKIGSLTLLTILLFACTKRLETSQSPVIRPINTKSSAELFSFEPTSTPENIASQTKTFSLQNANKIAPADILKEVTFKMGGGGFGCGGGTLDNPTIYLTEENAPEWMATIGIVACGWEVDDLVQMTLSLPNGMSIVDELQAQKEDGGDYIYVKYIHMPKLDDPVGIYSIKFSGKNGTVEQKINIIKPNEPRLYYIHDIQSLILYNFRPNERVRLFLYVPKSSETLYFMGWQEYQTDSSGQLIISADLGLGEYGVVGDKSGMVNRSGNYFVDPVVYINFFK